MKATQKMIFPFTSKNWIRPCMTGVHYSAERRVFEATSGHILIEWKDDDFSENLKCDVVLPIQAFPKDQRDRRKIRVRGKHVFVSVLMPERKGERPSAATTEIRREVYPLIATEYLPFPNTLPVWPTGEAKNIETIALSPILLSAFIGFCTATSRNPGMILSFYGETMAVTIKPNSGIDEWRGIIMPQRVISY